MEIENIQELVQKYLDGKCSPEEIRTVQLWYESFEYGEQVPLFTDIQEVEFRAHLFAQIKSNIQSLDSAARIPSGLRTSII